MTLETISVDPVAANLVIALMEQNAIKAEARGGQMLDIFDRQRAELDRLRAEVARLRQYEEAVLHLRDVMFPVEEW